jgi:hypothetical protein
MDECVFENSRLADSRLLWRGRPEFVVRIRGGRVQFGAPGLPDERRRKEWGADYAAELTGTQFSAEIPRCTIGDLVRVLELYRPSDASLVGGIHAAVLRRGTDQFWLNLVAPDGAGRNAVIVQLRDGRLEEIPRGSRGTPGGNDPSLATGCRPLAELLRASGLPLDTGCTKADFAQAMINNSTARRGRASGCPDPLPAPHPYRCQGSSSRIVSPGFRSSSFAPQRQSRSFA